MPNARSVLTIMASTVLPCPAGTVEAHPISHRLERAAAVDQEDDATDQIDGASGIREPWIVFRARD